MPVFEREWVSGGKKQSAWYWKFQINGVESYSRARNPDNPKQKARTKNEAKAFEARAIEIAIRGEPIFKPRVKPWTFERFVEERYRPLAEENHRHYQHGAKWALKLLLPEFGDKLIADISPFEIEAFKQRQKKRKNERTDGTVKPKTVNNILDCLSSIFTLAIAEGLRTTNPCASVMRLEVGRFTKQVLSREDEQRLLEACRRQRRNSRNEWPEVEAAIVVLVEGGFRPREFFTMKKSQVDIAGRRVEVISYKRGRRRTSAQPKTRIVPISDRALPYYKALLKLPGDKVYPRDSIRGAWKTLTEEVGLAGFWLRWLRDTAKHRWELAGFGPFEIALLMGHSSPHMTMSYSLLDHERARELMAETNVAKTLQITARRA